MIWLQKEASQVAYDRLGGGVLVLIALRRLMPWKWLSRGNAKSSGLSIFAEARQAANTTIPYAFHC